ncbi:hypothetical protein J8L84_20150 [Alteromonas sp. MMG017]|jgi:hypothetical protein|uniref:hypothetical protein n=1 Tax=Alteromonas sp. MMG017 TaxID=2822692 RepID=UPI001B3A662B|nr:hypothetical protein [Alteromonas sp. MMG017]MBQ4831594.1 hypothetical protein [Alteromonas sp. MMG017]
MSEALVKEVLIQALAELEESEDIIILNPAKNAIANILFKKVQEVSPNLLTNEELSGIISALNAHNLGFGLDDNDFQTIIGLTKEELAKATKKLKL